jgi:hypothetical protein
LGDNLTTLYATRLYGAKRIIGKDLEGNDHGLIEVLFRDLAARTEENLEKPQS